MKDIRRKFRTRSDHTIDPCLGESLLQYENLQLNKDERASSTSPCESLEPCNSDSLSSPEFRNSHTRKMLLFGQDKLLTRSILVDDSIQPCMCYGSYQSLQKLLPQTRPEVSHYSEELIIAKNIVRQAFARATERLGRLAKMAKRWRRGSSSICAYNMGRTTPSGD